MGKLALPQFTGVPGYSSGLASIYGPMRNPWDPERWAGGSSSGSAAAVAAGMAPFTLGAETWASIIGPAAFCGVTGLRPTWGRVSRFGAMPVAWSMDKIGPFARSARDIGLLMEVIAGEDARDATTAFRPPFKFHRQIGRKIFRLGVLPQSESPSPGVLPVFDEVLKVLRRAGMKLRSTKVPREDWGKIGIPIIHCEEAAAQRDTAQAFKLEDIIDENQRESMRKFQVRGPAWTTTDYSRAMEKRVEATRNLVNFMKDYDALISPTVFTEAPPVGTLRNAEGDPLLRARSRSGPRSRRRTAPALAPEP
jgi:aspartyl-tRNA(Asn)/glutamyl-tRNA(Gln) amidotransferase subunit A